MTGKRGNPGLKGKLLDKSIEAYILALEIINQLSVKYRVETFTYLISNAWELLLKAQIIELTGKCKSIYYPKKRKQLRRSLSLHDCLIKTFENEREPVRRNLERIIELRDESVHLVIAQVPRDVMGLFQACVLNYHNYLYSWFGISLSNRVPVGMMSIVYDFSPQDFDLSNVALKRKFGHDEYEYLSKFQTDIRSEFENLERPAEFSIDINYKLGLVKKTSDGDILLTQGTDGIPTNIVNVPKDSSISHPYIRKDVIIKIKKKYPSFANFRDGIIGYNIGIVLEVYNIKNNPEYYYKGKVSGSPTQYSDSFVNWLFKELDKDINFFTNTRQKAKDIRTHKEN
jgi:hypothetical protein